MKRFFAAVTVLLLFMAFAGCSDSTEPEPNGSREEGTSLTSGTGGLAAPVQVVEPMESVTVSYPDLAFPDLHAYANGAFSCDDIRDEDGFMRQWADGCQMADFPLVEAYVDLLCRDYGFSAVGQPYYKQDGGYYRLKMDFVLKYTGEDHVSDASVKSEFSGNKGDLVVSGYVTNRYAESEEKRELHLRVDYAKWLIPVDDGVRFGKEQRFETYVGTSFGAGLDRLGDGTYRTSDGRLSVSVGEAVFLTNGQPSSYKASLEWSRKDNQKRFCVDDKFGLRQMNFNLPITVPVSSGDLFTVADLVDVWDDSLEKMPNKTNMFAILHEGYYLLPLKNLSGGISRFNARMMYYDEDEETAVLYFCVMFADEPAETEGLVAVRLSADGMGVTADADYVLAVGESVTIDGPHKFGAGYSLWTWEYISGSEVSELRGSSSQTCTLIGRKPGTVRLKVTYEYSVKEPDILTGIMGSVSKEEKEE